MKYRIGDRLDVGGEVCTVKYAGEICRWPSTNAYGVEWDNPDRGKNDGIVNGIKYFEVSKPGSGSFMKAAKLETESIIGFPFDQAFAQKYLVSLSELRAPTSNSESKALNHFHIRDKVILEKSCINDLLFSEESSDFISGHCIEVTDLDLSSNLLSTFNQTCRLTSGFKNLQYLNLSHNIFLRGWDKLEDFVFPQLKGLQMVACELNLDHLVKILKCFPRLESLDVSWNHLSALGEKTVVFPSTLKELSLSQNSIKSVPPGISNLTLRSLDLSNNSIQAVHMFPSSKMRELDISYNKICNSESLDLLNEALPQLRILRVNGNPINATGDETANFYATIARFPSVEVLDGSVFSMETRKEAELFFVSQVLKGEIEYDRHSSLWKKLASKYRNNEKQQFSGNNWLESCILTVHVVDEENHQSIDCSILSTYTVRYLKTIIAQKWQLRGRQFQLFYYPAPKAPQVMNSEFRPVNYYGIENNTTLYVKQRL